MFPLKSPRIHLPLSFAAILFMCAWAPLTQAQTERFARFEDWMSEVPDWASLAEMSIPGTHESLAIHGSAIAVCQDHVGDTDDNGSGGDALREQLMNGARAVDIRVHLVGNGLEASSNDFTIHHGFVYQEANFTDVLREVQDFLEKYPTETVLMRLKAECTGDTLSCVDHCQNETSCDALRTSVFDKYVAAFPNLFWTPSVNRQSGGANVPSLKEVRGKLVLLAFTATRGGNYAGYGIKGLTDSSWEGGANCYVQDNYQVHEHNDINDKWEYVHTHLYRTNDDKDCKDRTTSSRLKLYMNWSSAAPANVGSVLLTLTPKQIAWGTVGTTGVNEFMTQCFEGRNNRCDRTAIRRTGIVMMDFPDETLFRHIIDHNPFPVKMKNLTSGSWESLPLERHGPIQIGAFDATKPNDAFSTFDMRWHLVSGIKRGPLSSAPHWQAINQSGVALKDLAFGDFNNDGEEDVFWADGSTWKLSYSGTSSWQVINNSGFRTRELLFGDFNRDGKTDVFHSRDGAWWVSHGGTSSWQKINTSGATVSDLAIGDFNNDGFADVFLAKDDAWKVSYNGASAWQKINTSGATTQELLLGDFNRDGRSDVLLAGDGELKISYGGTGSWTSIPGYAPEKHEIFLGDYDNDGATDILW